MNKLHNEFLLRGELNRQTIIEKLTPIDNHQDCTPDEWEGLISEWVSPLFEKIVIRNSKLNKKPTLDADKIWLIKTAIAEGQTGKLDKKLKKQEVIGKVNDFKPEKLLPISISGVTVNMFEFAEYYLKNKPLFQLEQLEPFKKFNKNLMNEQVASFLVNQLKNTKNKSQAIRETRDKFPFFSEEVLRDWLKGERKWFTNIYPQYNKY